jgi:hypothetical protein
MLNPAALDEILLPSSYLASLPGYSASLTNAEIADLVDDAVEEALGFSGGAVTLSDFSLFPAGTEYSPAATVDYAEGADAGLEDLPEPGSLGLLAAGLFGSLVWCRRRTGLRRAASRARPSNVVDVDDTRQ